MLQKVKDTMNEEWIQKLRTGDPAAFETLVRAHTSSVYKIAYTMMGNEHDAQDAVQEAFIKIYRALPSFRGDSAITTWMYRIAVNVCKDMLRRAGRFRTVSPDDEAVFLDLPDTSPMPDEVLLSKETKKELLAAIDELPTDYKLVITLCDLEGLPYIDAAQALDCPLGTVKSRLSRARNLLLQKLSEKGELFPSKLRQKKSKEDFKA